MPLIFGRTSSGLMVPVRVDASGLLSVENLGYIGGAWQKAPLPFGYSALIKEEVANTNLAAGSNTLNGAVVPAGEIWVITHVACVYLGTFATVILDTLANLGGTVVNIAQDHVMHAGDTFGHSGWFVLSPGDKLVLNVYGATAGDDAYLRYMGFRVDIDL